MGRLLNVSSLVQCPVASQNADHKVLGCSSGMTCGAHIKSFGYEVENVPYPGGAIVGLLLCWSSFFANNSKS